MTPGRRLQITTRALACAAAIVLGTVGLAACGDDDEVQSVAIEVTEKGKGSEYTAPESVEAGLAEIELTNSGKRTHDLQLVRVTGDRSAAEVVRAFAGTGEGKPVPDWIFAGGGVGITGPGQSQTVTQVLEPGTYYAFDTESEGPPDPKSVTALEVSGEVSDTELPDTEATVSSIDYGFETEGIESGQAEVLFENTGAQPHHVIMAPFAKGKTIENLRRFLKNQKGPPPINEDESNVTAVLEGGESQVVSLDLKRGSYALLCFISDRQGGPPHAFKGMFDEVEVK